MLFHKNLFLKSITILLMLCLIFSLSLVSPSVAEASELVEVYIHDTLKYNPDPLGLQAFGLFRDGTTRDITREGFWFSDNLDIAEVSEGLVTFKHVPGLVNITFVLDHKSITLTTEVGRVTGVNLGANAPLAYSPTPLQLNAEVTYSAGENVKVAANKASWFSSNPDVATVSTNGELKFTNRPGKTAIGVMYISPFDNEPYRNEVIITVTQADIDATAGQRFTLEIEGVLDTTKATSNLQAIRRFANGDTSRIAYDRNSKNNVQWSSSNPEVAAVDKEGKVSFTGRPGLVTITARFENQEAGISTYIPQKIMQLVINESLNYSKFFQNNPPKLTASGIDNGGISRRINDARWSSSNEAIATIDEYGQTKFSGTAGTVTFTATREGLSATVTCVVPPGESRTLSEVKIRENLFYGAQTQFLTAYAVYDDGSKEDITLDATWNTSNPNIATVQRGMIYFSGRAGIVQISINYQNLQNAVQTIVSTRSTGNRADLDYIKFALNHLDYEDKDKTVQVYGVYSDNSRRLLSGVDFHSYQPNIASIRNGRLVLSGNPGTVVLEASYQGLRTTLNLDIKAAQKANEPSLLKLNGTLDDSRRVKLLQAELIYPDGRVVDVTDYAVWNTGNAANSTIVRPGQIEIADSTKPIKITAAFMNKQASTSNKAIYQNGRENPLKVGLVSLSEIRSFAESRLAAASFLPPAPDIANHWARDELNLARKLDWIAGYPDGTIKPNQRMTRAEFAALLYKSLGIQQSLSYVPFTDIKGHWAEIPVSALTTAGIIPLTGTTFRPNASLTRGEMAIMLANFLDVFPDSNYLFLDVPSSSAIAGAVAKVNQAGVMSGMDSVYFRPGDFATRAQATSVLLRMLRSDPETALVLK